MNLGIIKTKFERSPAHSPSFRRKGGVKQAGEALCETDHMLLDGCMLNSQTSP